MSQDEMASRINGRLELFGLRERIWVAIREAAREFGGGFPGISYLPPLALAHHMRGHGPFEGDEGERRLRMLSDFDALCRRAFDDQATSANEVKEHCEAGERLLVELEQSILPRGAG